MNNYIFIITVFYIVIMTILLKNYLLTCRNQCGEEKEKYKTGLNDIGKYKIYNKI